MEPLLGRAGDESAACAIAPTSVSRRFGTGFDGGRGMTDGGDAGEVCADVRARAPLAVAQPRLGERSRGRRPREVGEVVGAAEARGAGAVGRGGGRGGRSRGGRGRGRGRAAQREEALERGRERRGRAAREAAAVERRGERRRVGRAALCGRHGEKRGGRGRTGIRRRYTRGGLGAGDARRTRADADGWQEAGSAAGARAARAGRGCAAT